MQASASERLRQIGLSYLHPHPIWLTQTRSLPLEPPPPEEVIPQWKLIRPRKKKTTPSDEPIGRSQCSKDFTVHFSGNQFDFKDRLYFLKTS